MKWVTRQHVHLDRVASPWLIKRFVDPDAEFVFVPWLQEDQRPADAVPLALPGAELGPHDAAGTTFEKIVAKYRLDDPAIGRLGRVIKAGVDFVIHGSKPAPDDIDGQTAVGLVTIAEGMWLIAADDDAILEAGFVVYDALYANFRTQEIVAANKLTLPGHADGRGPSSLVEFLRATFNAAGSPPSRPA
jgi:hypothetical protein